MRMEIKNDTGSELKIQNNKTIFLKIFKKLLILRRFPTCENVRRR